MADNVFDNVYNPDVLSCLANLSNDEVFTPPEIANAMLDMLPPELFQNPNTKFLDPAVKSGVFLREITKRLIIGLVNVFPNLQERLDHILHEQVYGIAITELTSFLSRRSLYCSKYPNGKYSVSKFDNPQGNIRFKECEHAFVGGTCKYCGASEDVFGKTKRFEVESHAYEFIHTVHPEDLFKMKFDVIIGNPPYQLSDGGNGASASPIYQLFIEQAKKLKPRYLSMIVPARWYAGGKGLDEFRKNMLEDKHISRLVDYVNAKDCFPGTSIGGGVCYFLWERDHEKKCYYTNIHDGKQTSEQRDLNEYPIFVRYNEALSIIKKVMAFNEKKVSEVVETRNPFGLSSSTRGNESGDCELYFSGGKGFISRNDVKQGEKIIEKYKVMISKVTSEHAGEPDKSGMFTVVSTTKVLKPNAVCTDSYLIVFNSDNEKNARNFEKYLCTKFFRFLLLQAVSSINLSKDKFMFVPLQDFSEEWDDEKLFAKYQLSSTEKEFIESMIKQKEPS